MRLIPDENELWIGIGGTFDSFNQVAFEFIDNSIGNLIMNKRINNTILITINELHLGKLSYKQEDAGTGIKNIEKSLTIGNKDNRESVFNEHGFGMKHALASANPENNNWKIYSRDKNDLNNGVYKKVTAPYSYNMECKEISIKNEAWPGEFSETGTIIYFECSEEFFNTVQLGISGKAGLKRCLEYFSEDLGYNYSEIIKSGKVSLVVKSDNIDLKDAYYQQIGAVEPNIVGYYNPEPGSKEIDLGVGKVQVEYKFCEIKESNYYKYYLKNQATAGAEIRINGRLILKNVFKDIWGIEMHPHYNHFLAQINIISQDRNRLPKTRTTKNGIRMGDEKLLELYSWIRKLFPNPPRLTSGAVSERELLDDLKRLKEIHLPDEVKRVEREFYVFTNINCNIRVDLYVFDGKEVILYEGKKDDAEIQNIYQLMMYWDGCVCDGIKPDKGVLIASSFSDGVIKIMNQVNKLKDANGNNYNMILKTWEDESIHYPK